MKFSYENIQNTLFLIQCRMNRSPEALKISTKENGLSVARNNNLYFYKRILYYYKIL